MAREKGGPHYVWGICTNLDKDGNGNPCPNCKTKERLKLSIRDEFVCPECGESLTKVKGPVGPNWKLIGAIIAAVVVLAGAGFGIYSLVSGGQKIDKIKLKPKSLAMVVGQKDVVKATVVDKDGNEIKEAKVTYKWTVADEKTASVTQGGEVTALKKGKTSVTVKIEGDNKNLRATCQIEVNTLLPPPPPPVDTLIEKIAIVDAKNFELTKGGTKQLQYQAYPEPNRETPVWQSSNPSVATVDANGVVTAVMKGKAEIIVKAKKVQSTPVTVTVKEEERPVDDCNKPGEVKLPFGVYDGPRSNCKANGIGGTIRFTRSYTIDLKKSSGETVEVSAGDRMINVKMKDNRIIQGQLKRTDGSQRMIVIGG